MVIRTGDHPAGTIRLAEDQMEELRELLRPSHKMASIMLDQHQAMQDSRFGGENAGSMEPGEQFTGDADAPAIDDASKDGGEGAGTSDGACPGGTNTGIVGPTPALDDASKQGSG